MILRSTSALALIALTTAGCPGPGEEPITGPVPFAQAAYHTDCAPWDGAAITLYLSDDTVPGPHEPPRPHVSIALYQTVTTLLGSTVRWEGRDNELGFVTWCPAEGECREASRAMIRVTGQGPDGRIEGEVRLAFGAEDEVSGTFTAVRIPFEPICG